MAGEKRCIPVSFGPDVALLVVTIGGGERSGRLGAGLWLMGVTTAICCTLLALQV